MADLARNIEFYEIIKNDLELKNAGRWVLIHLQKLINVFDNFDEAAKVAVNEFGHGPYLIRQIAAPPVILPASVAYFFQRMLDIPTSAGTFSRDSSSTKKGAERSRGMCDSPLERGGGVC